MLSSILGAGGTSDLDLKPRRGLPCSCATFHRRAVNVSNVKRSVMGCGSHCGVAIHRRRSQRYLKPVRDAGCPNLRALRRDRDSVWIDTPLDVQGMTDSVDWATTLLGFYADPRPCRPIGLILRSVNIIEHLNRAERPLLFIGNGVRLAQRREAIAKPQAKSISKIPTVATWPAELTWPAI